MISASPIGIIVLLTVVSAVLLAIGLILHRKAMLRSRAAALAWAVITVAPLFVGGWFFAAEHDPAPIPNGGVSAKAQSGP